MTETKAVPALLRALNERTILEAVRASGPVSRAEVARRTGISRPTVSLFLRALLEDDSSGRPRSTPDARITAPSTMRPIQRRLSSSASTSAPAPSARALCDLAGEVRAREEIRNRLPAVVSPADGSVSSPDLPGLGASDLREQLERAVGAQVTLENDVNLAALGEQRHGVAQGVDDFAFLLVGAGLGAAVVLAGKLHRGRSGAADELDVVRNGRPDDVEPCAAAISQRVAELAVGRKTVLEPPFEMRELFAAAREGTPSRPRSLRRPRTGLRSTSCRSRRRSTFPSSSSGVASPATPSCSSRSGVNWRNGSPAPRVEVSPLGEAAVLEGAVAAGVDVALERLFVRRARA